MLHESRRQDLACARRRGQLLERTLTLFRTALEHADAPALVNAYEMLRQQSSHQLVLRIACGDVRRPQHDDAGICGRDRSPKPLSAGSERDERARQALGLLLEDSGAEPRGHLFLLDANGVFAAASLQASEA